MTEAGPRSSIGYLVSEYPAPSHTFIRREIEALRAAGLAIRTYSVRTPQHALRDERERAAVSETFYIVGAGALRIGLANLTGLVRRPVRFLSTLRLALRHRVPGVRAFIWSLFHFAEAVTLAQRLSEDGVVRLHNHFGNAGATVGLLAAQYLDVPWSLTLHGISEFDYPAGNLLADKLDRADFAACVSYFGMAQAMRLTNPSIWHKLHVVRCGIDPSDLPSTVAKRTAGGARVICVGRLSPEKGHVGLFNAMRALLARGLSMQLVLVGDGPQRAALESTAADMGIAGNIDFLGALDEPSTLAEIAASDILVLPSFMEGLPIVLMEAMALRVPVIASRVAGIPELMDDGSGGLLFDPANWIALEDALAHLITHPELRQQLAAAGYDRVQSAFFHPAAAAPLLPLLAGCRVGDREIATVGGTT